MAAERGLKMPAADEPAPTEGGPDAAEEEELDEA